MPEHFVHLILKIAFLRLRYTDNRAVLRKRTRNNRVTILSLEVNQKTNMKSKVLIYINLVRNNKCKEPTTETYTSKMIGVVWSTFGNKKCHV